MKSIKEIKHRNFTILITAIDMDNWDWKVKRLDGSLLAKCEDDELEYDEESAIAAAKEAIEDWHNN